MTSGSLVTTLSWDADERLTGVSNTSGLSNSYSYNGLGQRSGKGDSTGTFSFTREDDDIDSQVLSDGAARYVSGSAGLLSEVQGGASKFYHADALGSTRALTNSSGSVTDTKATDAFGVVYAAGTSGSTPTPFGFAGAHGYQSDVDMGLQLLGHRYYDSSVGRFLSRDPIQAGRNWYAYCGNDPVNGVDPKGLDKNNGLREYWLSRAGYHIVKGTVFGGANDPNPSSYPPFDLVDGNAPGASLPGYLPRRWVEIVNVDNGKVVTAPIVDIGPLFDRKTGYDKYWDTGTRPASESLPNRVKLPKRKKKTHNAHAGIDLTPKTASDLGITNGEGHVAWRFIDPPGA